MASELVLSALDAASLIDWATTCVVAGVGLLLDKGLPPFEHQIGPQLSDPRIAYPHTPGAETHCPKPLLVALAFLLPLALLACTQLVRPSRHDFNHALLGMVSSLSFSLMLVAIIKAAAGRLRPDFLARCKPVDGVCTGARVGGWVRIRNPIGGGAGGRVPAGRGCGDGDGDGEAAASKFHLRSVL